MLKYFTRDYNSILSAPPSGRGLSGTHSHKAVRRRLDLVDFGSGFCEPFSADPCTGGWPFPWLRSVLFLGTLQRRAMRNF